jgi:DNA ligase (NAD+)
MSSDMLKDLVTSFKTKSILEIFGYNIKDLEELRELIKKASQAYYIEGEPIMTDYEFDTFLAVLKEINPKDPLLTSTGHGSEIPEGSGEYFKHPLSMGSIDKEKNRNDLIKWLEPNATGSTKIDGNSIAIYYDNGVFQRAVTRGRDDVGIDRSAKFKNIVPKEVPYKGYFRVRGEAAIKKENYAESNGFDVSKASRNAVAGAINRKDDWEFVFSFVDFIAYEFIDISTGKNLIDLFDWKQYFIVEGQKDALEFIPTSVEDFKKKYKDSYSYESDGHVFMNPNGSQKAFKYEDEFAITSLLKVVWSVGKDQRLTPVAHVKPTQLSGATITKASLGSYSKALSLRCWPVGVEHEVKLIRANEIIPHILETTHKSLATYYGDLPTCPSCNSKSTQVGEHVFCVNDLCSNLERSRLFNFSKHFCPKSLGEKILEKFFDFNKITSILDLVKKPNIVFSGIEGIGDSFKDLLKEFHEKLSDPIDSKLIYRSLVKYCGRSASEKMLEVGLSFPKLLEDPKEISKLSSIRSFNSNITKDLLGKIEYLKELSKHLTIIDVAPKKCSGSFCCTGVRFSQIQLKMLLDRGWKEDSSLKKTTDVLVCKDPSSSSGKIKKAREDFQKNGKPRMISIEDFMEEI